MADFFSNFYISVFSILAYSEYQKLGFQKSEIFKHPSFRYSPVVNIENLDFKNPRFSNIRVFDIRL